MNVHWRKLTNERQGKPANINMMRLLEQSLEIVSVLKGASRNFNSFFSLKKAEEKL
jgi:hypothetical protein